MRRMFPNLYRHNIATGVSSTDTKKYYFSIYSLDSTPITIDVLGKYLAGINGVVRDGSTSPKTGPTFYALTGTQKSATEVTCAAFIDGVQASLSFKWINDNVKVM